MTNPMHHPDHPIWAILKIAVICFFAAVAMWIYATQFDETEVKSLITFAGILSGSEVARRFLSIKVAKVEK